MATIKAIEIFVSLRQEVQLGLGRPLESRLLVDSKDLYNSVATQHDSLSKSVRGDVNYIRFVLETELDFVGWIPRFCNPADVCTKHNSSLTDAVTYVVAAGSIPVELSLAEVKSNRKRLG